MNEPTRQDLLREIHELKYRLAALERKVTAIPKPDSSTPTTSTAPPVISSPPDPPKVPKPDQTTQPAPSAPSSNSVSLAQTEFAIGAKLLPWTGAAIVIVGLISLVTWAVQEGLVTPAMRFAGSLIFGIGLSLFGHRFQSKNLVTGSILTGLGSATLFMATAAGGTTWAIYPQNAIVPAFVVLAALNVLYGSRQSNQSFVCLGYAGGALASLLAGFSENPAFAPAVLILALTHFGLYAVTTYKKWWVLGSMNWMVSGFLFLSYAVSFSDQPQILTLIAATALVSTLASVYFAIAHQREEHGFFTPLGLLFVFGITLHLTSPVETLPAILTAASLVGTLCLALKTQNQALTFLAWLVILAQTSVLIALSQETQWAYLPLLLALALAPPALYTRLAKRKKPNPTSETQELGTFLVLSTGASIGLAFVFLAQPLPSIFAGIVGLLLVPFPRLASRLPKLKTFAYVLSAFYLGIILPLAFPAELEIYAYFAIAVAVTIAAFRVKNEVDWVAVAWYHYGILTYCYLYLAAPETPHTFNLPEPVVLVPCLALLATLVYRTTRDDRIPAKAASDFFVFVGTSLGLAIVTRAVYLLGDLPGTAWYAFPLTIGMAVYSIVLLITGFRFKSALMRFVGFFVLAATCTKLVFLDLSSTGVGYRIGVSLVLGLVMIALSYLLYLRPRPTSSKQPTPQNSPD